MNPDLESKHTISRTGLSTLIPMGKTQGSKKPGQANSMPVSKKQTQIWFGQEIGHEKIDPLCDFPPATQKWFREPSRSQNPPLSALILNLGGSFNLPPRFVRDEIVFFPEPTQPGQCFDRQDLPMITTRQQAVLENSGY